MTSPKIIINKNLQKQVDEVLSTQTLSKDTKIPEYEIRSESFQSQNSCTFTIYLKCPLPGTLKHFLHPADNNQAKFILKVNFDKNLRTTTITQLLPEMPKSIAKITLTLTKIEVIFNKSKPNIPYNLTPESLSHTTGVNSTYAKILMLNQQKKASDDADAIFAHEYKDMPSLIANDKLNAEWDAENYVDSDDSSLAGIDDIEWMEKSGHTELAKPVISESEGGVVPDYVKDNMAKLKIELEQGKVKNQV